MKKLLFIAGLFITANSFGQAIKNGNFESWNSTPYSSPNVWYTSNPQSIITLDSINCTKVTGFSGSAVHLHTIIKNGDTDYGYIINTPYDPQSGKGGVPYSSQSTGITGYYKYNLPVHDTAILFVLFKKSGAVIGQYQFKIRGSGSQPTFTSFTYNFVPALAQAPDTVIIAAASSNAFNNVGIQNGSWLELDELGFTGPNSPLPGGTFDTWTGTSFNMPLNWSMSSGGPSGSGVARSAIHYAGSYSISLTTQSGGGGGGINAAEISNGYQPQNNGPKGGQPYTTMIDTLKGYYQYATSGNDSATVNVQLTNHGSSVGGNGMQLPKVGVWTFFKMPFQSFSSPDTILIQFASSVWDANGTIGSILLLDNVSLASQPLGLSDFNPTVSAGKTYPNPAINILNVELTNTNGNAHVYVYDVTGRVVMENNLTINNKVLQLNIAGLNNGVYFYKIDTENGSFQNKFVKQ